MLEVAVAYDVEALMKLPAAIDPLIVEALHQNAETILEMAKLNCPVRTGALRASLHIEQTGEFEYAVRDGVPYGIFVEKGHRDSRTGRFVEPRPFLIPAVDFTWPICEQRIKKAITTATEKCAVNEVEAQKRSDARLMEIKQRMGIKHFWER